MTDTARDAELANRLAKVRNGEPLIPDTPLAGIEEFAPRPPALTAHDGTKIRPTRSTRTKKATPPAPADAPQRRHATGAGMRLGGDHPALFYIEVWGTIAVALAAFTISVSGLLAVARWQHTPDFLHFLTPVMVDLPIAVFTTMTITFKYREQHLPMWLARVLSFAFAGFSAAANFLHTTSVSGGLDTYEQWIGAVFNGVAPLVVLACTEFLGHLITRPKAERGKARRQAEELASMRRKVRQLERRLSDAGVGA